jgi:glucokinase
MSNRWLASAASIVPAATERAVPIVGDRRLVHEQRERPHRQVGLEHRDERGVSRPRRGERGGPRGLDRAAEPAEHRVHVRGVDPLAREALPDLRGCERHDRTLPTRLVRQMLHIRNERSTKTALMGNHVLAVDIGGTKLAAAIVADDGRILERSRAATPANGDADALFATLTSVIEMLSADARADAIACGVGSGGPMRNGNALVSPVNIPAWRDFPLRDRLHAFTGLPTTVENDAKALALGEGWVGAAVGERNYLAMVVSTGIGGGIVIDGRLLDGADANAGHVGHVIVEPDGRVCGCGGRGCAEAEASGTAIRAITGAPPKDAPPEIIERSGRLVGRAVASVANLLDLPLAVVSGSVALGYGAPFFAAAQAELDLRCRLAFSRGTRIEPGGLGADGPLIGAAALVWSGSRARPT